MNSQLPESVSQRLRIISDRVIEKFGTRSEFFFYVGCNIATGSRVLNGFAFLTGEERHAWADALDLPESIFPVPLYRIEGKSRQIVGWSDYRKDKDI